MVNFLTALVMILGFWGLLHLNYLLMSGNEITNSLVVFVVGIAGVFWICNTITVHRFISNMMKKS